MTPCGLVLRSQAGAHAIVSSGDHCERGHLGGCLGRTKPECWDSQLQKERTPLLHIENSRSHLWQLHFLRFGCFFVGIISGQLGWMHGSRFEMNILAMGYELRLARQSEASQCNQLVSFDPSRIPELYSYNYSGLSSGND